MRPGPYSFDHWAMSEVGLVRELNEDRFLARSESGLWLVADGMGGHDAGEVASAMVVDNASTMGVGVSATDVRARFLDRMLRANAGIRDYSSKNGGQILGSTMTALLAFDSHYACAWSGDSRVYLLRNGELALLTKDHTEVAELLESGAITAEEAETWPRKNVITAAIGVHEEPRIDLVQGDLRPNDCFILCSDGLTGHVSDQEILELAHGRRSRDVCESLVGAALAAGGTDNVTVVVVQCRLNMATIPVRQPSWTAGHSDA